MVLKAYLGPSVNSPTRLEIRTVLTDAKIDQSNWALSGTGSMGGKIKDWSFRSFNTLRFFFFLCFALQ